MIKIETRKKITLGGRTRIQVGTSEQPEDAVLWIVEQTPVDCARDLHWPDGHVEFFYWNNALQLVGPGDSRLLPENLRHESAKWYVESGRIYQIVGNQVRKLAEVARV